MNDRFFKGWFIFVGVLAVAALGAGIWIVVLILRLLSKLLAGA